MYILFTTNYYDGISNDVTYIIAIPIVNPAITDVLNIAFPGLLLFDDIQEVMDKTT